MRVTQSMLSSNMLRNLSNSYSKMGKLQEQIATGKKINRPSDDPLSVMKGLGYRTQVTKVEQYQRNIGEAHNWLDNTDDALDKVNSALKRAYELVVNASTDTMTPDDRDKLRAELEQIKLQVQDIANTKVGNKYLFSGTNTSQPLFVGGTLQPDPGGFGKDVEIEVFNDVSLKVNTNGIDLFDNIDQMFGELVDKAITATGDDFSDQINVIQGQIEDVLAVRADVGARQNRVDMMTERLAALELTATKQMSDNEDVDYERTITEMITEESVHRAALSVGSRIIQPTLVDFLR